MAIYKSPTFVFSVVDFTFYFVIENLVLRARSEAVGSAAECFGKKTVARRQNSSMELRSLRSNNSKIEQAEGDSLH